MNLQKVIQRIIFALVALPLLTTIACNMAQTTIGTAIPTPSLQPSLIVISTSIPVATNAATNAPSVNNQVNSGTASTGVLSVYPADQDPNRADRYIVQPGSTITIRVDGLQNIASVWFHVPSNGWHGNGWEETPRVSNPGSTIQAQVLVASDVPGTEVPFSLEAIAENGQRLNSTQPLWVKIDDSNLQPSMGTISVSPYIPSQEIPDGYAALPGSTITIGVDGMQDIASVKFHIPPEGWGKGVVETAPIMNPGFHAEITLIAPMRKASGIVTAIGIARNGKVIESRLIWLNVESPVPTASVLVTPSN